MKNSFNIYSASFDLNYLTVSSKALWIFQLKSKSHIYVYKHNFFKNLCKIGAQSSS
ncbi:hypothetical protein U3516DRAFT_746070 [Neocallimastix sp. 'constans']